MSDFAFRGFGCPGSVREGLWGVLGRVQGGPRGCSGCSWAVLWHAWGASVSLLGGSWKPFGSPRTASERSRCVLQIVEKTLVFMAYNGGTGPLCLPGEPRDVQLGTPGVGQGDSLGWLSGAGALRLVLGVFCSGSLAVLRRILGYSDHFLAVSVVQTVKKLRLFQ